MDEVCYDVGNEPNLQLLQGESFGHKTTTTDEGRVEIKADGLGVRYCPGGSATLKCSTLCRKHPRTCWIHKIARKH